MPRRGEQAAVSELRAAPPGPVSNGRAAAAGQCTMETSWPMGAAAETMDNETLRCPAQSGVGGGENWEVGGGDLVRHRNYLGRKSCNRTNSIK